MPRTLSYLSSKTDAVGKKVKAVIVKVDKDKGSVVVSRKELIERDKAKTEEIVNTLLESKEPVVGTVKKITSYGMFVDVGGMDGLVHYSQISHKGPVNPAKYFSEGDEVNVIALEYDKKKRHLSLSIKDANPDPWADIDSIIGVGDTVTATVSNIEPYGVFVDLGEDLEAFLHVSARRSPSPAAWSSFDRLTNWSWHRALVGKTRRARASGSRWRRWIRGRA